MSGLSAVAGIMEKQGGIRVVVTERWRLRYHVKKGERLFITPIEVKEPVPWDEIPTLIEKVQKHVLAKVAPDNACGDCKQCCILPLIDDPDLQKPAFQNCRHLCSSGCSRYWMRPKSCKDFKCMWLLSQSRNDRMGPELRPDRCGTYFNPDTTTNDPLIIEAHGPPNADAWKWINEMQRVGYKVREITSYMSPE